VLICREIISYEQHSKNSRPVRDGIFGATGDLTKRKLLPALYNLAKEKFLPENFAIVGVGRQEMETAEYRRKIINDLKEFASNPIDKTWSNGLKKEPITRAAILTMIKSYLKT
jgi:glucose-6-phosphate 1-dehydrogenase